MASKNHLPGPVGVLVVLVCVQQPVSAAESNAGDPTPTEATTANLLTVESEIFSAIQSARDGTSLSALDAIESKLKNISPGKSTTIKYYRDYWLAFLKYQKSMALFRAGRREDAKAPLNQAIDILDGVDPLDSEMHALRAITTGLYLQFVPRQEIFSYLGRVNASLAKSLEKGKNNIRAYYVNASSDFYTPKQYGGGKRAESLLLQALDLDTSQSVSPNPTWGRSESMALLIDVYWASDRKDQAEELFRKARSQYPNSIQIAQHKDKF